MSTVDRKDLHLFGRNTPHPAGNAPGIAIPRANKRVAIGRQARFAFRKLSERTECYPRQVFLDFLWLRRAEDVTNDWHCKENTCDRVQRDTESHQHRASRLLLRRGLARSSGRFWLLNEFRHK